MRHFILLLAAFLTAGTLSGQTAFPAPEEMHKQIIQLDESGNAKLEAKDYAAAAEDFQNGFLFSQEMARVYDKDAQYALSYRDQCFYFLERLGMTYTQMGKLPEALHVTEQATGGYEEILERNKTPENQLVAADLLIRLSWLQLKLNQPELAEKTTLKGLVLEPDQPAFKINLAHSLLLTGRTAEALEIYKAEQNKPLGDSRTAGQAVLDDFNELEALGVRSPEYDKVRQIYGVQDQAVSQPKSKADKKRPAKNNAVVFAIVGGIFLFIVAIFWFLHHLDKKRIQKIESLATQWGWQFRAKATPSDLAMVAGTQLETIGNWRHMSLVMELPAGSDQLRLFEFNYTEGQGKSKRSYQQTVTQFISPAVASLPAFILRPEGIFDKLVGMFGAKDIDFPEHAAFSKKNLLKGPDEAAIRALFTPEVISFFEKERGWVVEVQDSRLTTYQRQVRPKPEDLQTFVDKRQELFALLTRNV